MAFTHIQAPLWLTGYRNIAQRMCIRCAASPGPVTEPPQTTWSLSDWLIFCAHVHLVCCIPWPCYWAKLCSTSSDIMFSLTECYFAAHVHPVCSVTWSRNGAKLCSASTDNTVSVWDVLTGECDYRWGSEFCNLVFSLQLSFWNGILTKLDR